MRAAEESPKDAEHDQRKDGVAAECMKLHRVAADRCSSNLRNDEQHEQPVEDTNRHIPCRRTLRFHGPIPSPSPWHLNCCPSSCQSCSSCPVRKQKKGMTGLTRRT